MNLAVIIYSNDPEVVWNACRWIQLNTIYESNWIITRNMAATLSAAICVVNSGKMKCHFCEKICIVKWARCKT